jgi:hypothetical protein
MSYKDPGAEQYEQQYHSRVLANLKLRAKSLGFVLQAFRATPIRFLREVPCDLCWSAETRFRFIEDRRVVEGDHSNRSTRSANEVCYDVIRR